MPSGLSDPNYKGVGTGGMTAYNDGRNSDQQVSEKANTLFNKQTVNHILTDRVKKNLRMLGTNPMGLGYSEGQQRQMVDQAAQNAQAQRAAQTQQLGQQALAGQGFQQGAFSQAARQIGADAAQDVAQASSEVASLNEQKIQAEKSRILEEAEALRQRRADRNKFWLEFGLDFAQLIGEVAT